MSVYSYLGRLRRWAKPAAKPRQVRARLGLETLEDRLVPSAVTIDPATRVLTYQAAAGEVNNLQISRSGNIFTFTETGGVGISQGSFTGPSVTDDSSLFDRIQVNLDDQDDNVTVLSTNRQIDIAGQADNDTVTVGAAGRGLEDILATINADGGRQGALGKDQLILADRDAPVVIGKISLNVTGDDVSRVRVNAGGVPIGTPVSLNSTNMETLVVNASNQADVLTVNSTLAATPVEVNAGAGADAITLGNLYLMQSKVTVRGEKDADTLTINDTAAAARRTYTITATSVKQGTSTVDVASLEGLTIRAPNVGNTFDVQGTDVAMPLTLNGGTGGDTFKMSDSALTAGQTYNFNAGSLERGGAKINYTSVEALAVTAGSGADTFKMSDVAQPTLSFDGGKGADTIDYSSFTGDVTVNLATRTATKVSSLSNVENATGGAGNDILVGDANANVLKGNAGRDLMIGGRGADTLRGGADEDLMIASDTNFDTTATSLTTISSTWAGAGTALDRVNQLKLGVGAAGSIKLNDLTVHVTGTADDGASDQLFSDDNGPAGAPNIADWFWANPGADSFTLLTGDFFK
jgi:Ca2+-binding RTX toxin-like protein